jgi:taurine transport system permease protein
MSQISSTDADLRIAARPADKTPSRRRTQFNYATRVSIATFIALIALWWFASHVELVSPIFLPPPEAVIAKLVSVSTEGFEGATLAQHLWASLLRVLAALAAAAVLGIAIGFAISLNDTARGVFEPIIEFYRPIPPLAYLPLVIIWFGIGEFAKILVIFLGILPSIVIATVDGLRSVAPDKINAARSLGATKLQLVLLVLLPQALPSILTGIRIGLGTGWATLVAAELIAATQGLGYMIKGAADFLVTDVVILGIIVIALVSIGMELALRALQKLLVPWQGRD